MYVLVLSSSAERRTEIGTLDRLDVFAGARPADFGQLGFATVAAQGGNESGCLNPVPFHGFLAF